MQLKVQSPNKIMMIRPFHFGKNPQTIDTNYFQHTGDAIKNLSKKATDEFDKMVDTLKQSGIDVIVFEENQGNITPDAVFSNNWISVHSNRKMILYPMYAINRRLERNIEIIKFLNQSLNINQILDLSNYEEKGQFLEGTGSMVFDHINETIYACESSRTNLSLLQKIADTIQYDTFTFESLDIKGRAIYHTNVMMNIGEKYAIVCLDSISNPIERLMLRNKLEQTNRIIIDISFNQMNNFCGNCFEVIDKKGNSNLVLSTTAYNSFSKAQITQIESYTNIICIDIPLIEKYGGGGVRCMITALFSS